MILSVPETTRTTKSRRRRKKTKKKKKKKKKKKTKRKRRRRRRRTRTRKKRSGDGRLGQSGNGDMGKECSLSHIIFTRGVNIDTPRVLSEPLESIHIVECGHEKRVPTWIRHRERIPMADSSEPSILFI